jgi:hypothetical protein
MAIMAAERLKSQITTLEGEAKKARDILQHVVVPEIDVLLKNLAAVVDLVNRQECTVIVANIGILH